MKLRTRELRERNNERDGELTLENREYMTKIICYLRERNTEEERLEDIRQDVTDMLTEAQDRGERAEAVLGEDYKVFCDEILESLGERPEETKTKENFCIFIAGLPLIGLFTSGVMAFFYLCRGREWSRDNLTASLISPVFYIGAAILVKVFTRGILDIKMDYWIRGKRKYLSIFLFVFFLASEILYYLAG